MSDREKLISYLEQILRLSKDGRVEWLKGEDYSVLNQPMGRECVLRLPQSVITICKMIPPASGECIVVNFCDKTGEVVESVRAQKADSDWKLLCDLYQVAVRTAFPSRDEIVTDLEQALAGAEKSGKLGLPAPEEEFLKWVAGPWSLFFQHGTTVAHEDVRIDLLGQYYVIRPSDTGPKETQKFILTNILYSKGRTVSFTKEYATGPRANTPRQTEVLRISDDGNVMEGFAQHDAHRLRYVRMVSKFRFRFATQIIVMPMPAIGKQQTIAPSMIEVNNGNNLEIPPDAKLWRFTGLPVELPKSPLPESDWDSWWANFQKTHRFSVEGMTNISQSPDWQWVEIIDDGKDTLALTEENPGEGGSPLSWKNPPGKTNDNKIAAEITEKINETFRPEARKAVNSTIVEQGQKLLIDYRRSLPVMIDISKIMKCFDTVLPVSCSWQPSVDGEMTPGIVFDGAFGGRLVMVTFVLNEFD